MKKLVRMFVEGVLGKLGYELKEKGAPPRGFSECLAYAKSRGLAPATVFDVGVGFGTPWLYQQFEAAKLVLFEPLPIFHKELQTIVRERNADLHTVALSDRPGSSNFRFNATVPTSSSLLEIDPGFVDLATEFEFSDQTVRVDTLDSLNSYDPPYLLKIDVEGAELQVLSGAERTLTDTEFVLAEISVMRRLRDEPTFADIIQFLDRCDFALYDIPSITQLGSSGQLIYLDAAFVKKESNLWPRFVKG